MSTTTNHQTNKCWMTHQMAVNRFLLLQKETAITLKLNTAHTAIYKPGNHSVLKRLMSV